MPSRAKGSTVQSTVRFLTDTFGREMVSRVLARLTTADQATLAAVASTDEVPYEQLVRLWRAADDEVTASAAATASLVATAAVHWAEASGEAAIGSYGVQLYGGILRKPSPREFLTQSISLFRLYYQPGDMEVVEDVPGRAVLRLVGFDPVTSIFCRRQTGGLRRAIALAGGESAQVKHVRCCIEGDAFCEWELHWQSDGGTAGARGAT
jgi:hypothetical protein